MVFGMSFTLEIRDEDLSDFWKEVPDPTCCSMERSGIPKVSRVYGNVTDLTPAQAEALIQLVVRYHIYKTPA